jgi:putative sugar O-methyltransferase
MKSNQYKSSKLWAQLETGLFANSEHLELADFRRPEGVNSRLASWDPTRRNLLFFKHLLFNTVIDEGQDFLKRFDRLGRTDLGNPIHVEANGRHVDLDYLLAVQEAMLLEQFLPPAANVCEIGAGFGRTCHALMRCLPGGIGEYTIIDLDSCMAISRKYLREVLSSEEYERIRFVSNGEAESVGSHDMFINIDSMAEMDPEVVHAYLELVDKRGGFFYSRNPLCKYTPEMIGATNVNPDQLEAAMQAGVCREVADIFSTTALDAVRKQAEDNYRPGAAWKVRVSKPAPPYRYYQHMVYEKAE